MSDGKNGVFLSLPLPDEQVFRYQAADDILELLFQHPHREFTVTQLREVTGHGGKSVDNAVGILLGLDLIERRREGRRSLIGINQTRLEKPADPILEIPQPEFREPVRAFLEGARERQGDNLVAVILFGSVARGEADRTSDIDIQVIVEDELLEARRRLNDLRQELEEEQFDGDRYDLQVLVESVDTAASYGEKLRKIHAEGVTLYASDELADVRDVIFDG